jgi:hypothetical protein
VKAGERIRLIKESAHLIAQYPEKDMQLILRQHGVDTRNPWNYHGDLESYALDRLEAASDDVLRELHEYVAADAALHPDPVPGDPWATSLPARVFISHVHHDKVLAGDIKRFLGARYGVEAFVAHDDITPSRTWREQIKRALATCHYFVAILKYPEYHQSEWCDQEVGWALARGIPILPVRPLGFDRKSARDGFLEEHQDISLDDAHGLSPEHFTAWHIFMGIVRAPTLRDVATQAVVEAFVTSGSYDATRKIWALIEKQQQLESSQLRRLEYAVQTNDQVYDANLDGKSIPDLVKALVNEFEPPADDEPPF